MSKINSYFISSLVLNSFRNYKHSIFNFENSSHVIYGGNGLGKTNILEAISILSAGKGIRSASIDEIIMNSYNSSGVMGRVSSNLGSYDLNLSIDFSEDSNGYKKKYFLDGTPLKSKSLLDYYLNCIWLIPQMDNFFLQDNTSKRKFIDRLIFNLDKSHLSRLNEHDKLIRERNKLLQNQTYNAKWLDLIEEKLVEITVPLVVSRLEFIDNLNSYTKNDDRYPLELNFKGEVENLLEQHIYSLKVENLLKEILQENRKNDLITGQTTLGAHKSKLSCKVLSSNNLAEHASTGEQKMMLISIIISFTKLVQKVKNMSPILLLDEVNVHLDENNTRYITQKILDLGSQVFLTTTHKEIYKDFEDNFKFLKVDK